MYKASQEVDIRLEPNRVFEVKAQPTKKDRDHSSNICKKQRRDNMQISQRLIYVISVGKQTSCMAPVWL